jgi:hypothetical protein
MPSPQVRSARPIRPERQRSVKIVSMLEQNKAARDYLREEGQVIRQAPIAFTAGCFLSPASFLPP